jgi:DNA-binding beta-propeller fold protein YncE
MSSITYNEFIRDFGRTGKRGQLTACKTLGTFKNEYKKLSDTNRQLFYEGYLKYSPSFDEKIIQSMNEIRTHRSALGKNSDPVYHYNSKPNDEKEEAIYVETFAGVSMPFEFTKYLTVGALKENIKKEKLLDCDTAYQRLLVMPNTVLEDDSKTLVSYGVTAGTIIKLFCNMKYLKLANDEFVFHPVKAILKDGMCISPDSQYIYVPLDNEEAEIYVINTSDGSIEKTINLRRDLNPLERVDAVYLSPDGTSFFVTGKVSSTVRGYNSFQKRLTSNQQYEYASHTPHFMFNIYPWSAMCISPNGDSIFIADEQYAVIWVFDASNGTYTNHPIGNLHHDGNGEGEFNEPLDICMSQTGELFISDSYNNRVQVFNAKDRTFNRMFKTTINGKPFGHTTMDVSPDGKYLYVVYSNEIHVLDTSNGLKLDTIIVDIPYISGSKKKPFINIRDICASPNGDFLFVLFYDSERNSRIVKYAVFGSTAYSTSENKMGGKRHKKKGIRQKRSKNRARYSKKHGTKKKY